MSSYWCKKLELFFKFVKLFCKFQHILYIHKHKQTYMAKKPFPMKDRLLQDLIENHVNHNITSYWDINQDGIIELDGDYYIQYSHDYLLFCEYPFIIGSQLDAIDFSSDYPNFLQTILDKVA